MINIDISRRQLLVGLSAIAVAANLPALPASALSEVKFDFGFGPYTWEFFYKFIKHEFEKIFGLELECKEPVVTLGGWLTQQLGDIPAVGAEYATKDFVFYVLAADPNRIRRIYVRRLK